MDEGNLGLLCTFKLLLLYDSRPILMNDRLILRKVSEIDLANFTNGLVHWIEDAVQFTNIVHLFIYVFPFGKFNKSLQFLDTWSLKTWLRLQVKLLCFFCGFIEQFYYAFFNICGRNFTSRKSAFDFSKRKRRSFWHPLLHFNFNLGFFFFWRQYSALLKHWFWLYFRILGL